MSIALRSFDILFCLVCVRVCVCVTHCMYCNVHEACQLMDIIVTTECNVIVFSLCSFSLLHFFLFLPWILFTGCSLLSVLFFSPHFPAPSLLLLSALSVTFPLCLFYLSFACFFPAVSTFFPSFRVFLPVLPPSPLCPLPPTRWAWVQETSGLSSAAGCGRHGEDAWARLEVRVHVPAGVLQGSGDERPG